MYQKIKVLECQVYGAAITAFWINSEILFTAFYE